MVVVLSIAVLGISKLNESEKLIRCQFVVTKSLASLVLPLPTTPDLGNLQTMVDEASQAKQDTVDAGPSKTSVKNDKFRTMNNGFISFKGFVQAASNGDAAFITATGMYVKTKGVPTGIPAKPQDVSANFTDVEATLDVNWDAVDNSTFYMIQHGPDPNDPAQYIYWPDPVTKSKVRLTGLQSLSKTWVRIAAFNASGRSAWSDPAVGVVA